MTMTTLAVRGPQAVGYLDIASLRRAFLVMAFVLAMVAPFTPDPLEFGVGAFVPWIVLAIAGTPTLPAALVYFLLWQWLQVFARTLVGVTDGEPMARSLAGPWVINAYWYMLASVVVLAVAVRFVMGSLRPPAPREADAHLAWGPVELFQFYLFSLAAASATRYLQDMIPSLDQPLEALARVKSVAVFMLFVGVFSARRGFAYMLAAIAVELVIGFSGVLGDFRSIFIFLFVAALAARVRWTATTTLAVTSAAMFLVVLGLFWTSVKNEYRQVSTGSDESQYIKVPLDVRFGYLGRRVANAGDIDWGYASYLLLNRLAYVDIFGSVIGVKMVSPEEGNMRQWSDALAHVFQPRALFPDKPALSDSEVFMRLARADMSEQVRAGTSISVGYVSENFVDLGFPWMLGGIFVLGVLLATVCRYFMTIPAPWVMREGTVLAIVYLVAQNGVEVSLPKMLGAVVMGFVVYAGLAKFAYPMAWRWLDRKAVVRRQAAVAKQRAMASRRSSYQK